MRHIIEDDIKAHEKDIDLSKEVVSTFEAQEGEPNFVTFGGKKIHLNIATPKSKKRKGLIDRFARAITELDAQQIKELTHENDTNKTPFIAYEVQNNQFVVRNRIYSQHEINMINPLPQLIAQYIDRNGPMRFDQFWGITQYLPGLGIYQKLRHFDDFFESVSSSKESLDFALGVADYISRLTRKVKKIKVIEIGAGTGDHLFRLLTALKYVTNVWKEAFIVETSETLRLTQQHKLSDFDVTWVEDITEIEDDGTLTFIVCEMVLDSFPYRVFQKRNSTYHEVYIGKEEFLYDEKGIPESDPIISEIKSVHKWPSYSLVYRSVPAEIYLQKLVSHFKHFALLMCDHMTPTMDTTNIYEPKEEMVYRSLHLVGLKRGEMTLQKNAGEFMMACSLYLAPYQRALELSMTPHLLYEFSYARDFFKRLGEFKVYEDYPQFILLEAHSQI